VVYALHFKSCFSGTTNSNPGRVDLTLRPSTVGLSCPVLWTYVGLHLLFIFLQCFSSPWYCITMRVSYFCFFFFFLKKKRHLVNFTQAKKNAFWFGPVFSEVSRNGEVNLLQGTIHCRRINNFSVDNGVFKHTSHLMAFLLCFELLFKEAIQSLL